MDGYIVTLPDVEDTEGAQQAVANLKRAVLGFEARRKSDPSKVISPVKSPVDSESDVAQSNITQFNYIHPPSLTILNYFDTMRCVICLRWMPVPCSLTSAMPPICSAPCQRRPTSSPLLPLSPLLSITTPGTSPSQIPSQIEPSQSNRPHQIAFNTAVVIPHTSS